MSREPPRPATRYASTLVGVEENGNGHGPQTDRPRPLADLPRQELAEDTARQIGLLDGKVDALQEDMREVVREGRESSRWRKTVDARLGALELGVFEILGLVKGAEDRAARAERKADAAKDESARASQTNEIATKFTEATLGALTKEQLDKIDRRRRLFRTLIAIGKAGGIALVGAVISMLFAMKGCHP